LSLKTVKYIFCFILRVNSNSRGNRHSKNGYRVEKFFSTSSRSPLPFHIGMEFPTPEAGPYIRIRAAFCKQDVPSLRSGMRVKVGHHRLIRRMLYHSCIGCKDSTMLLHACQAPTPRETRVEDSRNQSIQAHINTFIHGHLER
jgi:hypothetical protein